MDRVTAPFDESQIESLNRYQRHGGMHPFTCGNLRARHVSELSKTLVADADGWSCPTCNYTQEWAWDFMANFGWRDAGKVNVIARIRAEGRLFVIDIEGYGTTQAESWYAIEAMVKDYVQTLSGTPADLVVVHPRLG